MVCEYYTVKISGSITQKFFRQEEDIDIITGDGD